MSESAPEQSSGKDVLFRNPSIKEEQILIVPADKVEDYKDAGWERVKRDDEAALRSKAVPAPRVHKLHFGDSIVA